ncbi:MAG TPA: MATE family efflux transporter, partial [Candidatus Limnocylindrales bacterium]
NHVLIHGAWHIPALGVAGAGLASLMVAVLMGGSLTAYLFVSSSFAEFDDPAPVPLHLGALWRLAASGALMGLIAVSETGVFLASTIVVGLLAPQDVLAHVLAFRAMAVCYLFVAGIGQAVTIRVAFLDARAAGSRHVHTRRAVASSCMGLVVLVLALFLLGADRLAGVLAAMVGRQGGPADHVAALLPVAGLTLAALAPAHLASALLRARNDVAAPTAFNAFSYWGVALVAMSLLVASGQGARGAWLGLLLGASVCSACFAAYLWAGARRRLPPVVQVGTRRAA